MRKAKKMLELIDVSKIYKMGEGNDGQVFALKKVSLKIEAGDYVAIMGPSGSGKSSLMNVLGLLDSPTSGSYKIDGRDVSNLNEDQLAILRRKTIGFIFQQFHLLPRTTAIENVSLPQLYLPVGTKELSRASVLLEKVGLGSRKNHRPTELSGGQQQRVAIARALINAPSLLFADEPTGNLDSNSRNEILAILRNLNKQGITIVMVTHEEEIGAQAKRRIRMRDGEVQSDERLEQLQLEAVPNLKRGISRPDELKENTYKQFSRQLIGLLSQSIKTLWSNRIRSALSMLGILIGVAAVVTMMAIGTGARKQIERQMSALGSNLLILRPGALRVAGVSTSTDAIRLALEDADALKENFSFINETSSIVTGRVQASYLNKNWRTNVNGVDPSYVKIRSLHPTNGRFFAQQENQTRAMVAVLGHTVASELFGNKNPVGEMIKLDKLNFQVVGVLPQKGAAGSRDQDDVVAIPVQTAMRRLVGQNFVDSIEIEIKQSAALASAPNQIIGFMSHRHHIPPSQSTESFRISNMASIQKALSSSGKTMSTLLASIAAISLLVGGIGIMNIMLVSVTERTREIGLRKAIGAKRSDILFQFMIESIVLTLISGFLGILGGVTATQIVAHSLGWATRIEASSIMLAFLFSVSIGLIFGIYPARRASFLNPIEALRHE
jgi:macrolide transport system ATP-binding/permease protein